MTNECIVCERTFKGKLVTPKCCQRNSESQYKLCGRCVKKCNKCPLCRSPKRKDIYLESIYLEIKHIIVISILFQAMMADFLILQTQHRDILRSIGLSPTHEYIHVE